MTFCGSASIPVRQPYLHTLVFSWLGVWSDRIVRRASSFFQKRTTEFLTHLRKGGRKRGIRQSHRWTNCPVASLEPRQLLTAITYSARQDGFAQDAGLDGTFETLTLSGALSVNATTGQVGLFEFDLGPPVAGQTITNPKLSIILSNVAYPGGIVLDFYGYSGDGAIALSDATQAGTLLGTLSAGYSGSGTRYEVFLNQATFQTLRGANGKIGVRAVARQGYATIGNQEAGSANAARITYDAVNTIAQTSTLDFERLAHSGSVIPSTTYSSTNYGQVVYQEDGYSIAGPFTLFGTGTSGNFVGSTTLASNYSTVSGSSGSYRISRSDGAAFALKSLDLSKFGMNEPDAYVLFTGTKVNGTIVEQAGWASHFQLRTEQFAGFDNLRSLSWNAPARINVTDTQERFQIDNIVLESLGVNAPETTAPVLANQQFAVNEEAPVGTVVGQLTGIDPSGALPLNYSLVSSSVNGAFSIDSSGRILVANSAAVDFQLTPTIELFVRISNGNSEFDVATVRINVQDVVTGPYDRLSPSTDGTQLGTTVTTTSQTLNINQVTGSNGAQGRIEFARGTITANELQAATLQIYVDSKFFSNTLTVQGYIGDGVLTGNEGGSVDLWTGTVTPGWNAIPLNATALRTLTAGSHFGIALVNPSNTAYVSDYEVRSQEHASGFGPRLKILRYTNSAPVLNDVSWTLPENSYSIPNSKLAATDANPGDTLTYSLLGSSVPGAFGLNTDGTFYVANWSLLNFEVNPTVTLTVQVTDSGSYPSLSDTATVTINLTDVNEGPVLSAAAAYVIPENSPAGTVLGTVPFTTDPEGDAITFSLQYESDAFEVDPATGQIRVKSGANPNRLSYESQSSGSIYVKVQDARGYSSSYTYYYQLTDVPEAPAFPVSVHTLTAGEFLPAGTVLMTLAARDQDFGSVLTYSITSVVGAPSGAVAVDPSTGRLTVVDPTVFNTEVRSQFTVNVQASDNTSPTPLTGTMAVVVNLTSVQDIVVPEYSTTVGTVLAPASFGASRTFTILSGNSENRVAINPTTGLLTATDIDSLQFRETPSLQLVVRISDGVKTFDRAVRITLTPRASRYQNYALSQVREYIGTPDASGQRTWNAAAPRESLQVQGGSGVQSRVAITTPVRGLFVYGNSPFLKLTVLGSLKLAAEAETVLEIYATIADSETSTSIPNEAARGVRVGRLVLQAGNVSANRTYLIPLAVYDQLFSSSQWTTLTVRNDTNANVVTLAGSPAMSPNPAATAMGPELLKPTEIFARDSYSHPFFLDTAPQDGGKLYFNTPDGYSGPGFYGRSLLAGTWWRLDEGLSFDSGYWLPTPYNYKLLGQQPDGTWTYIENSSTLYPNWSRQSFPVSLSAQTLIKGNFVANNGYGNSLAGRDSTGQWWVIQRGYYSPDVQAAGGSWSTSTTWADIVSGDFDADGFDEVAGRDTATGQWTVSHFTSTGMVNQNWGSWSTATTWSDVQVGDFNGDGRADILGRAADGQVWLSRSTGTGFVTSAFGAVSASSAWAESFVGDFDHDQRMDLLVRNVTGEWWLARTNRATFDIEKVGQWAAAGSWSQGVVYNGIGFDHSGGYGSSSIVTIESATNRMWVFDPQTGITRVQDLGALGDSPIQLLGENRPLTVPERGGTVAGLTGTASSIPPRYRRASSWGQYPTPLAETYTAPQNESVPATPKVIPAGTAWGPQGGTGRQLLFANGSYDISRFDTSGISRTDSGHSITAIEFQKLRSSSVIGGTLRLSDISVTTPGMTIEILGYSGDGVITTADATASSTVVATATISGNGILNIPLNAAWLQSQAGSYVGLIIRMTSPGNNAANFSATMTFDYAGANVPVESTFSGEPSALDGNTLAVSTPQGIEVYTLTGKTWTQQATLRIENSTYLVGLSLRGDLLVALDGIHNAYEIFERSGTTWKRTGRVLRSEANPFYGSTYGNIIYGQDIVCDNDLITKQNGVWTVGSIPQISSRPYTIEGDRLAVISTDDRRVEIYERVEGQWIFSTSWNYGQYNGYSNNGQVVLAGDRIFITDPSAVHSDNVLGYQSGTVFVYQRDGSRWNLVNQIWSIYQTSDEYSHRADQFGQGLAVSGNFMAVSGRGIGGRIDLFELIDGNWTPVGQAPLADSQSRLSIAGRTVLASHHAQGALNKLFTFPYSTPAIAPQTFSIKEQSLLGTVVGSMAVAPPAGQTFSYSIIAGNTGDAFAIDPVTGVITVKRGTQIDFESTPAYALTIQVRESGGATATAVATVNVTNLAEPTNQIIDNGGTGFSTTGTWTSENTGRGGSVLRALIGTTASTASWKFTGLTPGVYQLAATWSASTNRTTAAPYTVYDASGAVLASKTFNQRQLPTEFVQDGSGWRVIGTVTVMDNDGTLEVKLSTGTVINYYIADAVRLDRVGSVTLNPEIEISSGGTTLIDGSSTLDFGTVTVGELASRDLRITNRGAGDLSITGITLPAGFVLRNALPSSLILGPGESYDLSVVLKATTAGPIAGTMTVQSNDADEQPFDVGIAATAVNFSNPQPIIHVSVDGMDVANTSGVVDFGNAALGSPISKTVRVENVGSGPFDLSFVQLMEEYANSGQSVSQANFRIDRPATFDGMLAPGESTTFTITYLANTPHMSRDRISLNWDPYNWWYSDTVTPVFFNVRGTVPAGELVVATAPSLPLAAAPGQSVSGTYTFKNLGELPVTLQPATLSGADAGRYTLLSNFTAGQIVAPGQTVSLSIQYTAGPIGKLEYASLNILTDGVALPAVSLQGKSLAPEISVFLPFGTNFVDGVSQFNFGSAYQGATSSSLDLLVQNLGTTDLVLQPATAPAGFTIVQNFTAGQILAPNATTTLRVQVDTSVVGTFTGGLSFANNDSDESPFDITLRSTILAAPEIDVQVNGSSIASGGSVAFGTSAGTTQRKTFRITNTGAASLSISQIYSTAAAFRILNSNTSGLSIPVGAWLDVDVEFLSPVAGNLSGVLVINNNDSNESSYSITMTGTMQFSGRFSLWDGTTEITNYGSSSYSLGTVPRGTSLIKTFTIKNTGTTPLALGTPTSGFALLDPFPATIPAGGQVDFRVQYFSATASTNYGTLQFSTSDSAATMVSRPMTATARTNQEITVIVDGSVVDNGGTISLGTALPAQPLSKSITIRNDGLDNLSLYTPTLSGTAGWQLSQGGPQNLAPGASATWIVRRIGFPAGNGAATLRFNTDDFDEGLCIFNLAAVVASSGEIAVSSDSVDLVSGVTAADFGITRQGTPVTKTFVLSNPSTETLYLGGYSVPFGYTLLDALPTTVAAGGQFSFRIRQEATVTSATAVDSFFVVYSSDADEPGFQIRLRQTTHSVGEIEVELGSVSLPSGGTLDFGTTSFGVPVTRTLTIRNAGTGTLTIQGVASSSGIQVVSGGGFTTLAAGATTQVVVRLNADFAWTGSGAITIRSTDSDESIYSIRPTGTVTASGEIQVTDGGQIVPNLASFVQLPSTGPGFASTKTLVVTNLGTTDLSLAPATISGPFTIDTNFTSGQVIAPGASASLTLRVSPASVGTYYGTLRIPNSDADESPFAIDVSVSSISQVILESAGAFTLDNSGIVNFGDVEIGNVAERVITLRNARTTALTLQPVIAPPGFTITQNFTAGQVVPAGGTAQLVVRMNTSSRALQSGQIAFQTSDTDKPVYDFRVMGNVIYSSVPTAPTIVGPTSFSFEEFSPRWTVPGRVSTDDINGDTVTYTILSGNPDDTLYLSPSGPDAGKIWVNKQDLTGLRHRGMFNLRIRATDNSSSNLFTDFDVQVFITPAAATTTVSPSVDGSVLDADGNGFDVGDAVNSSGTGMLVQGGTNPSRGVLEFDLSNLPTNRVLKNAWLFFSTSALVGGATVSVPLDIYGYSGNGTLEAGDAALGTRIGTRPISNADGSNQLKVHSAPLDATFVRGLIGTGKLGLVFRNDVTSDGVVINTTEAGVNSAQKPYLALQFSDLKPDLVVRDVGATGTGNQLLTLTSNGTSFTVNTADVFGIGSWERFVTGDFNADGRSDIAARNGTTGEWWVSLVNSSGAPQTANLWGVASPSTTWSAPLIADFDGDGKADISARNSAGEWWVWRSTGSALDPKLWGTWDTATTWQNVVAADFNRDGRADIAGRNSLGQWFVARSTGSTPANSAFVSSQWGLWSTATTWSDVQVGDFNGDGRADIAGRSTIGQWWVNRSTGTSFAAALFYGNWSTGTTWSDVRMADFNGDGRDDIVGRTSIGQWWVAEVGTSGFVMKLLGTWSGPQTKWSEVTVGDFNRDGRADLAARNNVTHEVWTSLWSPSGFTTNVWAILPDGATRQWRLLGGI